MHIYFQYSRQEFKTSKTKIKSVPVRDQGVKEWPISTLESTK